MAALRYIRIGLLLAEYAVIRHLACYDIVTLSTCDLMVLYTRGKHSLISSKEEVDPKVSLIIHIIDYLQKDLHYEKRRKASEASPTAALQNGMQ